MTPPTDRSQPTSLTKSFGAALAAAWGVGAVGAVGVSAAISPALGAAAGLAAGAVLVGVAAGLAFLALGVSRGGAEPGFVVLGASMFRALAALCMGGVVRWTSDPPPQPFWLAWLAVLGVVLGAEVLTAYRTLDAAPKEMTRS